MDWSGKAAWGELSQSGAAIRLKLHGPFSVVSKGISVWDCTLITEVISLKAKTTYSAPACRYRQTNIIYK